MNSINNKHRILIHLDNRQLLAVNQFFVYLGGLSWLDAVTRQRAKRFGHCLLMNTSQFKECPIALFLVDLLWLLDAVASTCLIVGDYPRDDTLVNAFVIMSIELNDYVLKLGSDYGLEEGIDLIPSLTCPNREWALSWNE